MINGKRIIHNYGHGGAGVTLSWGCADEIVEMIKISMQI
jgi:D-amino-acid oxidase